MPERIRLSHKFIDSIPTPSSRIHIYDEPTPGLAICVTPTGRRVFYWIGRVAGRSSRIQIGPYPQLSVEAARADAKRIAGDAASGVVPRTRRQRAKSEWTLGRVFTHFLEFYSKPHKRSWRADERRFDRTLADWRHVPMAGITKAMVTKKHVELGESAGHYAANATLELLSTLFNYARDQLNWDGRNAVRGVQRFAELERERFLTAEELPRFFDALAKIKRETSRDFFALCLFTGARRGNVLSMRYSDLDLERGEWRVRSEDSKSKEPMTIVLSDTAMAILKRREKSKTSDWVLPGHGSTGHFMWPKAAWKQLLDMAGISDLRIHDLRRTLGSWQAMGGSSMIVIGGSLGHKSTSATRVYARLQNDPIRQSVDAATAAMLAAAHRDSTFFQNVASSPTHPPASPTRPCVRLAKRSKKPKK